MRHDELLELLELLELPMSWLPVVFWPKTGGCDTGWTPMEALCGRPLATI